MAESPPNTLIYAVSQTPLTDAAANVWSINGAGQVVENGNADPNTSGVLEMAIDDKGVVWQENNDDLWWAWQPGAPGNYHGWTSGPGSDNSNGTATVPIPFTPTPNNTETPFGVTDDSDNSWFIENGQVVVDGKLDPTTANVTQMAIVDGNVWQENASDLWWEKPNPAATWAPGPGTPIDPTGKAGAGGPGAEIWYGGGNNSATNPADWSLGKVPVAGMVLTMSTGTMVMNGGSLAGDTLVIGPVQNSDPDPVIDMSNGASLKVTDVVQQDADPTFNVSGGKATLDLSSEFPSSMGAVINLANHSDLIGTFNMTFGALDVTGAAGTDLTFAGTSALYGSQIMLANATNDGTATINISSAQSIMSHLEIAGSVSSGITIGVSADPGRNNASSLVIDAPAAFKGDLNLAWSWTELKGLMATAYHYANDLLTLYDGSKNLGSFNVTTGAIDGSIPSTLNVEQGGAGVFLSVSTSPGAGLPTTSSDFYQPGGHMASLHAM